VAGRFPEPGIARQKRRRESFGQSNVSGVVCGQTLPEIPDPSEKEVVGIARQREIAEILESIAGPHLRDLPFPTIAPQDLRDLQIDQMGRVQRLATRKDAPEDRLRRRCTEESLEER
jgi:hypothetical protein